MISTALDNFNVDNFTTDTDTEKEEDKESFEEPMGQMVIGTISTAPGWNYTCIVECPIISTK